MKITRVCCQGCGANLEVDETIRFVTCNYCQARLEVVHDASTTHTRVLEEIREDTRRMVDNLRVIELQNDLERLDREWENRKESFMVRGKNGHSYLPSTIGSTVGGIVAGILGLAMLGLIVSSTGPANGMLMPFGCFGLLVAGVGIFGSISGLSKARAYREQLEEFQAARHLLIEKIDRERT